MSTYLTEQKALIGTPEALATPLLAAQKRSPNSTACFPEMPGLESKLEQISVQSMTYEMARLHADIRHVDLLHIDAEGHESFILRSIDFSLDRPDFILFEISHMDQDARALNYRLLVEQGYSITELGQDCAARLISKPCQMTAT